MLTENFDFILREHPNHEALFEKVLSGDFDLVEELKASLTRHIRMEEEYLFKPALHVSETRDLAEDAWKEHNVIMHLLQLLDDTEVGSEKWLKNLEHIRDLHRTHVTNEETKLFPKLEAHFSIDEKAIMARNFRSHRRDYSADEILYPEVPGSHQI